MFDYLLGNIVEIGKFVVLDNSGIGYKIFCSRNSLMKLAVGERAKLFIYLSIKEDSHTLFGFASKQEREIFEYFISTNGIGPKLALDILSTFSIAQVKDCILNERADILTKTPGMGMKKAKKLIIETKDKIKMIDCGQADVSIEDDITQALLNLGYSKKEIMNKLEYYEDVEGGIRDMLAKLS
ncbi:MAG TPA: Holliday junction branch migration protein RuvA [Fusobacteria bacterium]|nr:Holliday junction branch migration protein RuvA [Fusobacteriota bacterium]|tara:strand:- start:1671 stop:2219 length:549 start_codon:yes stop_codon:yes gene_type:complete